MQEDKERRASEDVGRGGRKISTRAVLGCVSIVCALVLGCGWCWIEHKDEVATDDAYTDGQAISMSPHVAGYVTELDVNDNQFVHKGQILLRIQSADYEAARDRAKGALEVAKGQLDAAQAQLELAKVIYPARLDAASAALGVQRANRTYAQEQFRRQHLVPTEATTQESIDSSTANERSSVGQVEQALANLKMARPVMLNIDEAAARVKQLQGQVKQAEGELAAAELDFERCVVTAPADGWITKRAVERGDYVQVAQGLFSIVTPKVWVTANFKEDQLERMRPGQQVEIAVDAYPNLQLRGHVDSIQLGSGARFTAFPPENATGNFVKIVQRVPVKIDIDSGLDPRVSLPLSLSVIPTVHVK